MSDRRRPRPKLQRPEAIDLTLDRLEKERPPWAKPAVAERVWREAVGPRIAERARPVEIQRGVLLVRVATSVWASELALLSAEIVGRLQSRGVSVTSLRFAVGGLEKFLAPREPRKSRALPPGRPLPGPLRETIGGVGDPELRDAVLGAASANLAWQDDIDVTPTPPAPASGPKRRSGGA